MNIKDIKKVNELHLKAMDKSGYALIEKDKFNFTEAKRLYKEAFELEKEAAQLIPPDLENEPSRSLVIHQLKLRMN